MVEQFELLSHELVVAGKKLYEMGWVPATSGNFSARLASGDIAITVSGRHKGQLTVNDIMLVDSKGSSLDDRTPSAETGLHVQIYQQFPDVNAVLHTHSISATVLSRMAMGQLILKDMEVLKAIQGIDTHATTLEIPIFPNQQDISRLAADVERKITTVEKAHAYLIEGHGLYTWGASISDTVRHLEAFEFLFSCEIEMEKIGRKQ